MGSSREKRGYRSYGKFKLPAALKKFQISQIIHDTNPELYQSQAQEFTQKKDFLASAVFQELFTYGRRVYLRTSGPQEERRKQRLMCPFLWEVEKRHPKLMIWEEMSSEADSAQGLHGTPDYVVTKNSNIFESPYCIIMEAKQEDFAGGWGQALAAMKGAQILNKRGDGKDIPVYGVVSTGNFWEFGKLSLDRFLIYPSATINILEGDERAKQVLVLLDIIFDECEKNME
jgi:hypothetical protein